MKHLLVLSLFAAIAACSPQIRVYSDHDPEYNLTAYKSFDWGQKVNIEEGKNPLHYNELNDKRIKAAVENEMKKRGYNATIQNPELIIHYHIIVDNQSAVATEPFGYHYGSYWTRTQTNVYSYREGTLIIDLMDSKTNNLVWRGWATSTIDGIDPEKVDGLIKKVVERIFKTYPAAAATTKDTAQQPDVLN